MIKQETYMRRCIALAQLGAGYVAPNPMVGAVLVYNDVIIGEGYHQKYGQAHAEVNCINSVIESNKKFICKSTLYVSLEPCTHFGKTPPCADFIINNKIPEVIIGCRDSFEKINGMGIEKLKLAGIKVTVGMLQDECRKLNKHFFSFYEKKRPYIILKWAQTNNGFIAAENGSPIKITNKYSNVLLHKWRGETSAILVGANTVVKDNPTLTVRNWQGKNPTRILIDKNLSVQGYTNIFNNDAKTLVINTRTEMVENNIVYVKINEQKNEVQEILSQLYSQKINSVIIEGGTKTLQKFINAGLWDEAIVITNTTLLQTEGVLAPILKSEIFLSTTNIFTDTFNFYKQQHNEFL